MIRAVIFDIGGVLARDVWENLLLDRPAGVAALYGLDRAQVYRVGRELWDIFAHRPSVTGSGWRELEYEYWKLFTSRLHVSAPIEALIELTESYIVPVEGMYQLLERLEHRGIELAILSDNTEFWYERQMDQLRLRGFFEPQKVILSCRVGVSKSGSTLDMFRQAILALDADEDESIFVDDRLENIERGLELGIAGIVFPSQSRFAHRYLEALLRRLGVL